MMVQNTIDDIYLFQDILNRNYFNDFQRKNKHIEFLLNNNDCSHNCINCYMNVDKDLYKNQDIFTPTKQNKYDNLLKLIEWYILNNFCCDIHIKGCIEEERSSKIFNIFSEMFEMFLKAENKPNVIYIYTKGINLDLLKQIILIFHNSEIRIIPVLCVNGYYCDTEFSYTEQQYSLMIDFILNNPCEVHAEINARNINKWIQNYKWWILSLGLDNCNKIYLKETLNDEWDTNSIQSYINFLDFQIDFLSENIEDFQNAIFSKEMMPFSTAHLIDQKILTNQKYYQDCLFHNGLTIDVSTLKMPTCSKLNYPIFHIGEFVYDEQNKLKLEPLNLTMLIPKAHLKRSCTPHCEYCKYINLCEKTCYGENFKVSYNPLCPVKNSCDLMKAKYNFLIYKYNLLNLLDFNKLNLNYSFKKSLEKIKTMGGLN